jgi:hypothetical protein
MLVIYLTFIVKYFEYIKNIKGYYHTVSSPLDKILNNFI